MKYIVTRLSDQTSTKVGNKANNLAKLKEQGYTVPDWFCILPEAFEDQSASVQIQKEIAIGCLKTFSRAEPLAVRSSAFDEDGATTSFAGQLDSFLNVQPDEIVDYAKKVFQSADSQRLRQYRASMGVGEKGETGETGVTKGRSAVIVQSMVDAKFAGVAFSRDPVTGENRVVVSATSGLADGLVAGTIDGLLFYVDTDNQIRPGGIYSDAEELESYLPEIAAVARKIAATFNCPQDIEWAHDGERLYVLQARPITTKVISQEQETTIEAPVEAAAGGNVGGNVGALKIWDNSNIAESYQGVTTPLTFSFARKAYEHVYIHFCTMMGVSKKTIDANRQMFPSMLGFIRGRIYYNLINWYRLLALLPGFQVNRSFMEKMMGVKTELSQDLVESVRADNRPHKLASSISLATSSTMMMFRFLNINNDVVKFRKHFESTFSSVPRDLSTMSIEEIVQLYRHLEKQLLYRWDAPIVNDFFAMIFSGLMSGMSQKWLRMGAFAQNEFLVATGGIISAEPAHRITALAKIAAQDSSLLNVLANGSIGEIEAAIERNCEFSDLFKAYLEKFGDRCFNELKLESPTLLDNPLPLLRNIGSIASQVSTNKAVLKCTNASANIAQKSSEGKAQQEVNKLPFFKRVLFNFIIKNATERIRCRENLRFERTRLFGLVRRLFLEIGSRLERSDVLHDRQDIFFLEVEEILSYVEGTGTTRSLQSLVAVRKRENAQYKAEDAPPNRIETRAPVASLEAASCAEMSYSRDVLTKQNNEKNTLSGLGCCPGTVRGRVRIVKDPSIAEPLRDEILIAERTDPGWIVLFTQARGIIVEYGSLLSHTAIVSRELGIPSIVSASGVMSWLKDGDLIEFDGTKGLIHRLEESTADSAKCSTKFASNIGKISEHDPTLSVLRLIDSTGLLQEAS